MLKIIKFSVVKLKVYSQLIRFDKPIGTLLLLWPTLTSLILASQGIPNLYLLMIFVLGTLVMRSAGCAINDYADRKFDGHVQRTKNRPIVTGLITPNEALGVFAGLLLLSLTLVLLLNPLTIAMSVLGALLATSYPFFKRFTYLPQCFLGLAMNWGIIMAYTAVINEFNPIILLLYLATIIWTIVYDTFYAMIDAEDDKHIHVKSTALLFGKNVQPITAVLQLLCLLCLIISGYAFALPWHYYVGLTLIASLFVYQQWLINKKNAQSYLQAFKNNNLVGLVLFLSTLSSFSLT